MGATTVVISSTAAIMAANAARAHRTHCEQIVASYNSTSATVGQMQEYSGCVRTLHPEDMTHADIVGVKLLLAIVLISMAVGACIGVREDGPISGVAFAFVFGAVAALAGSLLWAAVVVFSM